MKELSIEEKARRYDEAINKAKSKILYVYQPCFVDIKEIFPELKEYEDEMIGKELIKETKGSEVRLFETVTNDEFVAWLEKQGQKPIDKVEPKFHKGDWVVVDDGRIGRIIECTKDFADVDLEFSCLSTRISNIRYWTIQDAKDGDVLACPNDAGDRDVVFIFKNINRDEGWVFCFCASDDNGCFCTNNDYVGNSNSTNISPATKEQRDLLFAKMNEAGYEWDAEKKELKKIEQNNTDEYIEVKWLSEIKAEAEELTKEMSDEKHNFTDFERTLADICIGWIGKELGWKQYIKDNADVLLKIAIKKFNSVQDAPFEQKPAWSEDDENFLKTALWHISYSISKGKSTDFHCDTTDWLKSLKDRVQPQPKSEWSKEDERIYKSITFAINSNYPFTDTQKRWLLKSLKDRVQSKQEWSKEDDGVLLESISVLQNNGHWVLADKLKSLRPQNRWKPSDEQLEALDSATENCAYSEYQDCLRELIRQLKKLKEE